MSSDTPQPKPNAAHDATDRSQADRLQTDRLQAEDSAAASGHFAQSEPIDDVTREELVQRVVYAMLMPAVRLAFTFRMPVKTLGDLLQMAYYHETKRRGLKMKEVGTRLDISMRKVAQLSKRLKTNFLHTEPKHTLPRRIEFMLWAGPLSAARIAQTLPDTDSDDVNEALAILLDQARIQELPGRTTTYAVVGSEYRLVRDTLLSRIDGLQNLLTSVTHAVFGRFFEQEPHAFARTVSLRVLPEHVAELTALYRDVVWARLSELDEAAKGRDDAVSIDLSLLWAPYEYLDTYLDHHDTDAAANQDDDTDAGADS